MSLEVTCTGGSLSAMSWFMSPKGRRIQMSVCIITLILLLVHYRVFYLLLLTRTKKNLYVSKTYDKHGHIIAANLTTNVRKKIVKVAGNDFSWGFSRNPYPLLYVQAWWGYFWDRILFQIAAKTAKKNVSLFQFIFVRKLSRIAFLRCYALLLWPHGIWRLIWTNAKKVWLNVSIKCLQIINS